MRPINYSIQFDEPAHAEGFVDIIDKPFGVDIVAEVPMPHKSKVLYQEHTAYVRPNYYTMRLALDNSVCGVSRSDSLTLLIRYPSWILEQNWDDVVAPLRAEYNGGYEFGAYTWYVNDAVFPNDGLPYLYRSSRIVRYAYRRELCDTDRTADDHESHTGRNAVPGTRLPDRRIEDESESDH